MTGLNLPRTEQRRSVMKFYELIALAGLILVISGAAVGNNFLGVSLIGVGIVTLAFSLLFFGILLKNTRF
jgi:hypothetical protein